jgi:hypothetical protein
MAGDWHHVRHQKKIKGTGRKKIITTYTAKQIPVCKVHHTLIHNGKYDGPSLKKLKSFTKSGFEDLTS